MKKYKKSAVERFREGIQKGLEYYYRQTLSENVKRGLERKKKLSTSLVKNSKV